MRSIDEYSIKRSQVAVDFRIRIEFSSSRAKWSLIRRVPLLDFLVTYL